MLKKYSLKALQKAMHHAMALDPDLPSKISPLENKTLKIRIVPLNVYFYMHFYEGQLILLEDFEGPVDTTISSNPLGFIRLSLLPASQARSVFNDKIQITGDLVTGQQVKQLFDSLEIDWEGHLAHFTGDVVAHQLGEWFRIGRDFKRQVSESMRLNTQEYLQEELRVLPSLEELQDFYEAVDLVALAVARLEARIQRLVAHESH
jgi:ubiquinone biosynthesis accessory factor UbiJ